MVVEYDPARQGTGVTVSGGQ
jgi:hypothetical protein